MVLIVPLIAALIFFRCFIYLYAHMHKYSFYLFSKSKHLYYITTVMFRKVISFYTKNGNHYLLLISS